MVDDHSIPFVRRYEYNPREDSVPLTSVGTSNTDREALEREFKPFFDQHGPGVAIDELIMELAHHYTISRDKLHMILNKYDRNRNKYISLPEFLDLMTSKDSELPLSGVKRFISVAIQNVVPNPEQHDFLQAYTCCPPPFFIIAITIVQIGVFGVYAVLLKAKGVNVTATTGIPWSSPLIYNPYRRYEAWRFVTYMFLHSGYVHLISNTLVQLLLGLPLELAHKWFRVLAIYMLGVIAGSFANSLTDPLVFLVGASGGVYALMGGHIAVVITNWKELNYKCCSGKLSRMLMSAPFRLVVILLYVIADTGMSIYNRYFGKPSLRVGISAHIAGFIAGIALGMLCLRNIRKQPWEKKLAWTGLALYLIFVVIAILYNIFAPKFPPTDWRPCCPRIGAFLYSKT